MESLVHIKNKMGEGECKGNATPDLNKNTKWFKYHHLHPPPIASKLVVVPRLRKKYKWSQTFEHTLLDIDDIDFVSDPPSIEDSISKAPRIVEDDGDIEMLNVSEHDVAEKNFVGA
ncbi:unnamed protein product [Lupinus luteus]|uniref:Uncharacterized protein n=1 Tax=Lupinus luteus TaxID=3873 RepID=A0AAV1WBG5_LUPLU